MKTKTGKVGKRLVKINVYKPEVGKYNQKEMKKGIKVEKEHTPSKKAAAVITKHHLREDKKYYTKMAKCEKCQKRKCTCAK